MTQYNHRGEPCCERCGRVADYADDYVSALCESCAQDDVEARERQQTIDTAIDAEND